MPHFQACKDTQTDPDFCIVARVEAFIAGWGLDEALKRAEAYRNAGMITIFTTLSLPPIIRIIWCYLHEVLAYILPQVN